MNKIIFGLLMLFCWNAFAEGMSEDYMVGKINECWAQYDQVAPYVTNGQLTNEKAHAIAITSHCKRLGLAFAEEMKFEKAADCRTLSGKTICSVRKPTAEEKSSLKKSLMAIKGQ